MSRNFWTNLNKPVLALAPMEDITDAAFRHIVADCGKPDIMFTEFASVDGLCSRGQENILRDLIFSDIERPIIAQLFGAEPDKFRQAAALIAELGFDGIDINMGCPDKDVVKNGAGSALINKPKIAQEIIAAAKAGSGGLPVSVKTRIGFNKIETENWIKCLLEAKPAAITIHGRTKKEMSKVPTHWDEIGKAARLAKGSKVLILGNGDIQNIREAEEKAQIYGLDGAMFGRAVFGNPWLFNKKIKKEDLPLEIVLKTLVDHTALFEKLYGDKKPFALMKKHFASYLKGYQNVKGLKLALMETRNSGEVRTIISNFITSAAVKS